MAWINLPNGHTPADITAGAHITGGGHYPARRDPWADAIQQLMKAAPQLVAALKEKRNDEIANQIMNQWQPPRAEAVDQYGATYDPALAASQGYTGPEPMVSEPFTGGVEGFEAQRAYQKLLRQDEDQDMQRRVTEARITHLNAPRVTGRRTDQNKALTAYQERQLELSRERAELAREREDRLANSAQRKGGDSGYLKTFNSLVGDEGITPEQLAAVDTETADVVKYYRYEGGDPNKPIKLSGDEARALGSSAYAVAPGLPPVSLPKFNKAVAALKQMKKFGQGGVSEKSPTEEGFGGVEWIVGKKYKDKDGNVATYIGDGKWQ